MVYVPGAALKVMLPEPLPSIAVVEIEKLALIPRLPPIALLANLTILVPPRLFLVMTSAPLSLALVKVQSVEPPGVTTATTGLAPGTPAQSELTRVKPLV